MATTSTDGLTTLYRSPDDDIKGILDALPAAALRGCHLEIYGFTDEILVQGLNAAADRGCQNYVMNDRSQSQGPKDHDALVSLAQHSPNNHTKVVESVDGLIDHLKVLMVDCDGPILESSLVFFGSYNFSDSAEKQDNFACVSKDPNIIAAFKAKFDEDWLQNKQLAAWQIQPS